MLPIFAVLSEWHVVLALVILLLLFGGKKLPELARGLGEAIKEFTKSKRDIATTDISQPMSAPPAPPEPPSKPPQTPGDPQKPGDRNQN